MEKEKQEIVTELGYLRDRLEKLEQLFNFSDNDEETESLIYERKAVMLRYSAIIREAKRLGISVYTEEGIV